jgi:lysozyme
VRPLSAQEPRNTTTHRLVALRRTAAAVGAVSACASPPSESTDGCREAAPLRVCEDAASILRGVDISIYQATVDWTQVKAAGVTFAFARISDGTANPDAAFVANWQGMRQNGLVRGAYQYFRASIDPRAQANLVATSLQMAGGLQQADLPVVMDIETADGQSETTIEANMRIWLAAVEAYTARTPVIYTSAGTFPVTSALFAPYPLWVASYGASCPSLPIGWSQWKFWQTSSNGGVKGIEGHVDLDEYAGSLGDLMGLAAGRSGDGWAPPSPGDGDRSGDAGPTSDGSNLQGDGGSTSVARAEGRGAAMGQAGKGAVESALPSTPCRP